MAKKSAGLLMFRRSPDGQTQVLLVHPGGPFWAKKDLGAWTIPKGEYDDSEDALEAAKREFAEESDCDPAALVSNSFEMEWPPRSGRKASFVEIDRAAWFSLGEAREKLTKGQVGFLDALEKAVPRVSASG